MVDVLWHQHATSTRRAKQSSRRCLQYLRQLLPDSRVYPGRWPTKAKMAKVSLVDLSVYQVAVTLPLPAGAFAARAQRSFAVGLKQGMHCLGKPGGLVT